MPCSYYTSTSFFSGKCQLFFVLDMYCWMLINVWWDKILLYTSVISVIYYLIYYLSHPLHDSAHFEERASFSIFSDIFFSMHEYDGCRIIKKTRQTNENIKSLLYIERYIMFMPQILNPCSLLLMMQTQEYTTCMMHNILSKLSVFVNKNPTTPS